MDNFYSQYNIPEPMPFYAGDYVSLKFEPKNVFDDLPIDFTIPSDIVFKMSLYGDFDNPIITCHKNESIGSFKRMEIDEESKNILQINLFPQDTIILEDSWYDFQIKLISIDGLHNVTMGQGKVRVYKQIS